MRHVANELRAIADELGNTRQAGTAEEDLFEDELLDPVPETPPYLKNLSPNYLDLQKRLVNLQEEQYELEDLRKALAGKVEVSRLKEDVEALLEKVESILSGIMKEIYAAETEIEEFLGGELEKWREQPEYEEWASSLG